MLVSGLRGYHIIDVACGSGDAHSMAVADDGKFIVYLPTYRQYNVKRLDAQLRWEGKLRHLSVVSPISKGTHCSSVKW